MTIADRLRASRFLRRIGVVALGGVATVGVALWSASQPDPATPAQRAAALALHRCRGEQCFALQRFANGPICAVLTSTRGGETVAAGGIDQCPGDAGYSLAAVPVAQRAHRFLACAFRDGAIDGWHAFPSPSSPATVCGVEVLLSRDQLAAWVNRLDAASSTAFVNVRRSLRPADLLRPGGGAVSTWEGVDPNDETDDSASIDFSDPLDGGIP